MSLLSKMKSALVHAQEGDDPVYREITFSSTIALLINAHADFKRAKPHAVCPSCNGLRTDKCVACKKRGFVSQFYWDQCVLPEVKALIAKTK